MSHFALSAGATFSETLFPLCPAEERPTPPKSPRRKPRARKEAQATRVVERVVLSQRVVVPKVQPRHRYEEDAEKFDGLA